jgi:hypothetical protein
VFISTERSPKCTSTQPSYLAHIAVIPSINEVLCSEFKFITCVFSGNGILKSASSSVMYSIVSHVKDNVKKYGVYIRKEFLLKF